MTPKKRKYELIHCEHFRWRIRQRGGIWQADGRSNSPSAGRHSLDATDKAEALKSLIQLDRQRAIQLGLAKSTDYPTPVKDERPVLLDNGWNRYLEATKRPFVAGGTKQSTQKRYRAVINKFFDYAKARSIETWNHVTADLIYKYASHLEELDYASKTIRNEMSTLKRIYDCLIEENHLVGYAPMTLTLREVESERAYCYTTDEVVAMIERAKSCPKTVWLSNVITALATTCLRISELAGLKWADIDFSNGLLKLIDETGHSRKKKSSRRQTKSSRSRSLPIQHDLLPVLNQLPRMDAYVFHGPRGGKLKPDTVRHCLIRDVINPLADRFPAADDEKSFKDGRLHSFRHYFCSFCANNGVPEMVTMQWLGHADSDMVRHYYHLHDQEAQRQMRRLNLLGEAGQQRPGVHGAATNEKETSSHQSSPTIAS